MAAQQLDDNGTPISGEGWDNVGHQFTLAQSGPGTTDATGQKLYAARYAAPVDGQKPTYSASQLLFTPAATPTDVFTITGAAGKVVRVTRVEVTGLATTAGTVDVALVMRSTANTGGTSTGSPSAIPYDSADGPAAATVLAYTANPTLGTAIGAATTGLIRSQRAFLNVAATGPSEHMSFDFGNRPSKAVVLRGAAQVLAVNLNGNTLPAGTKLSVSVEWSEE